MWVYKLQTEAALYMLHAEHLDLYQSIIDLLSLKILCGDAIKGLGLDPDKFK